MNIVWKCLSRCQQRQKLWKYILISNLTEAMVVISGQNGSVCWCIRCVWHIWCNWSVIGGWNHSGHFDFGAHGGYDNEQANLEQKVNLLKSMQIQSFGRWKSRTKKIQRKKSNIFLSFKNYLIWVLKLLKFISHQFWIHSEWIRLVFSSWKLKTNWFSEALLCCFYTGIELPP